MNTVKSINSIQAQELIKSKEDLLIIDVRRLSEYKEGKIKNAINIPVDEIEWELDGIEDYKNKPVLVYCKIGYRSSIACEELKNEGFTMLYNLRGGILDFKGELE